MQDDASKHRVWVSNWLPLLCLCDISWKATTWNAVPISTRRVKLIVPLDEIIDATSVGKRHPNNIHSTSPLAFTSQQNKSTGTYPLHVLVIFCINVFTGLPVSGAVVLTSYTTTSSCFFSYVCGILTRWCVLIVIHPKWVPNPHWDSFR